MGKYDVSQVPISEQNFNEKVERLKKDGLKAPTVSIDGVNLPYIEFNFTGGTLCDLNKKTRSTRVLYVCSENSKHELHSVKELYTCEYEAIVMSPMLCLHRDYLVTSANELDINCYPVGDSPPKPVDIASFEAGMRAESKPESLFDGKTIIIDADSSGLRFQLKIPLPMDEETVKNPSEGKDNLEDKTLSPIFKSNVPKSSSGESILQEFLSGSLCLQGVRSWLQICLLNQVHHTLFTGDRLVEVRILLWKSRRTVS